MATTLVFWCGIHSLGFAIFHLLFWKLFKWKEQLARLGTVNRAIVSMLNIQLVWVFLLVAGVCFALPRDLVQQPLGNALLAGMTVFWGLRLVLQFVFLRHNHPFVFALTGLFLVGIALFGLPVFLK